MDVIVTNREQLKSVLIEIFTEIGNNFRPENPEKLFTFQQTAQKLGKSRDTIYRMVQAGRLQPTTDGKYISQQSINNYLNHTK